MSKIKQYAIGNECPEVFQSAEDTYPKSPLKFWEINQHYKCPVVGMCLTEAEQKQLLKKVGFSIKKKSAFEIHETLVASAESESRLSRRIDSLLNRKFSKEISASFDLDHQDFKRHFKDVFEKGDCLGTIWVAAIRADLPPDIKRKIFGDVHMTMHWSGEQSIKLKQRLARQEKEAVQLNSRLKEILQGRHSLRKENKHLKKSLAEVRSALAAMEKQKFALEGKLAEMNHAHCVADIKRDEHCSNWHAWSLQMVA